MKIPKIHLAKEALLPQPPIDWIVENFIASNCLAVAAGDGGSGKSFSLQDLGVCVASGKNWLSSMTTKQVPVLFIDEESGLIRFNRRLSMVMGAHSSNDSLPLFYTCYAGFDFYKSLLSSLNVLEKLIKDTGCGLVVIDALMDVIPGADENSTKDLTPFLNGLKTVIEKTGASIIVIHHLNKNGGYRGSSSIKGAVDLLLSVKKKGNLITFESEKNRDGEPFSLSAEMHWENDQFYLSEIGKNTSSNYQIIFDELKPTEKLIIEYLAQNGPSLKTFIESIPGRSKATLRDCIYSTENKKLLERSDNGGLGSPAIFELTTKGYEIAEWAGFVNDPWISAVYYYVR